MGVTVSILRKGFADGKGRSLIRRAILHQNRVKFHAIPEVTPAASAQLTNFLDWVSNLLPADKFKVFKSLLRVPLPTNEIVEVCFDKLSRLFDATNSEIAYSFKSPEYSADWDAYRADRLHEPEIWRGKGLEMLLSDFNSLLVVDLPAEQAGERPEPYFYWLPLERVAAFDYDRQSGNFVWVAFEQKEAGTFVVIDDEYYRTFTASKSGGLGEMLSEEPHGLGYTPVTFFWQEAISANCPEVKKSPLTTVLDDLDWYLFFAVSKRHLDLYGSYPIYSGYEQACDFTNEENGDYCDGGYLRDVKGNYKVDIYGNSCRCPKCGNKRIIGAGSFVEIPVPGKDEPDLRNPVQILSVDKGSLDFNVEEQERQRANIITKVVGQSSDIATTEAVNERQVDAIFESQETVLRRMARNFERAQKFVDDTICRLRYGDAYISASVRYGSRFFLQSADQLRESYRQAKESGASESELDAILQRVTLTENRDSPRQLTRLAVLADLEPYRHLDRSEVMTLVERGIATREEARVKLNFRDYVARFERDNMEVTEFGSALPYSEKIRIISSKIREYAREQSNNRGGSAGIGFSV